MPCQEYSGSRGDVRSISNGAAGAAVRVASCGAVRVPPRSMYTYNLLIVGKGAVLNFEVLGLLKYIGIYIDFFVSVL